MHAIGRAFQLFDVAMDHIHSASPIPTSRYIWPQSSSMRVPVPEARREEGGPVAVRAIVMGLGCVGAPVHCQIDPRTCQSADADPCPQFRMMYQLNQPANAMFGMYGRGLPQMMSDCRHSLREVAECAASKPLPEYLDFMFGRPDAADEDTPALHFVEVDPCHTVYRTVSVLQGWERRQKGLGYVAHACSVPGVRFLRASSQSAGGSPLASFDATLIQAMAAAPVDLVQRLLSTVATGCGVDPEAALTLFAMVSAARSEHQWAEDYIVANVSPGDTVLGLPEQLAFVYMQQHAGMQVATQYYLMPDMLGPKYLKAALPATTMRRCADFTVPDPATAAVVAAQERLVEAVDDLCANLHPVPDLDRVAYVDENLLFGQFGHARSVLQGRFGEQLVDLWRAHQRRTMRATNSLEASEHLAMGAPWWRVDGPHQPKAPQDSLIRWSPSQTRTERESPPAQLPSPSAATVEELADALRAANFPPVLLTRDTRSGELFTITAATGVSTTRQWVVGFTDEMCDRQRSRGRSDASASPGAASQRSASDVMEELMPRPTNLRLTLSRAPVRTDDSAVAVERRRQAGCWIQGRGPLRPAPSGPSGSSATDR